MNVLDDIWGMDLIFAAKTLRETREALEDGRVFKTDSGRRATADILEEAERIKALLARREAA